jgi:hypothetical protein
MNAAKLTSKRLQRVLGLLSDRKEHSTMDIIKRASVCAVNSIVSELRYNGIDIDCRQEVRDGVRIFYYRLKSGVAA